MVEKEEETRRLIREQALGVCWVTMGERGPLNHISFHTFVIKKIYELQLKYGRGSKMPL